MFGKARKTRPFVSKRWSQGHPVLDLRSLVWRLALADLEDRCRAGVSTGVCNLKWNFILDGDEIHVFAVRRNMLADLHS